MEGPIQTKRSASLQPLLSRIFLIGMSLFYISPMYWMLVTALKSDRELANFPPTLLRHFMLQIPADLSEAARIDGANEFQIMYRIILPLARPALVVVGLLAGVNAWNDFLGPLIYLQNDKLYTLSLGLTFFKTMHGIQFNLLMAASCLVVLPVIVVFLFFQRFFIEGISLGGK